MSSPKELIKRMLNVINGKSYTDLANFLGISRNTVDVWIRRGKIPDKNLIKFCQLTNTNLNWLLTGKGEMFLKDNPKIAGIVNSEIQNAAIAGHNGVTIAGNNNITGNNNTINFSNEDKMIQELITAFKKLPKRLQRGYYFKILGDAELYSEDENNDRN